MITKVSLNGGHEENITFNRSIYISEERQGRGVYKLGNES